MTPESGQMLSHYRLVERIGEGGMGVVWKAKDTVLSRTVAIKVLPSDRSRDETRRQQFLDEAKSASSVSDSRIVQVYEFGHESDLDYIVMEYVDGKPLNRMLVGRPLPPDVVVDIGRQVARALSKAHRNKLLHRDLKPANIMVTLDGEVKVVDFGLAMLYTRRDTTLATGVRADATTRTAAQEQRVIAGTIPYMSPEQVRGEKLDHRSDIFSLGAVLYEMTTGQRPFRGATNVEVVAGLQRSLLQPVHKLVPTVPLDLEKIIQKALAARPGERYQTIDDLAVDLKRLGRDLESGSSRSYEDLAIPTKNRRRYLMLFGTAVIAAFLLVAGYAARRLYVSRSVPPDGRVMLAVLPFDNLSGEPEQEYFSDGMTEELIAQMGRLNPQQLGVIARASVLKFKDTDIDIDQIGEDLGVHYLVDGSVRRGSNKVRIAAQLIRVSDQTYLWAENFDSTSTDALSLQSEVAQSIARQINIKLSPEGRTRFGSTQTLSADAFESYLRGRYSWNRRTPESMQRGIKFFRQAIEKDPIYALAYAGLADSYNMLGTWSVLPPNIAFTRAKAAAGKALEIDDQLAEARIALAFATFLYDWEWEEAEKGFKRALEVNPNYAPGHQWYAVFLASMGRHEEAITEVQHARDLDPLSLIINGVSGWILFFAGEYDRSIEQCRRTIELDPQSFIGYSYLGVSLSQKGMHQEAIGAFKKAISLSGGSQIMFNLGHAYAVAGMRDEATSVLNEMMALSEQQYVSAFDIAMIHVGLGQNDQAFSWLEKAIENRYPWVVRLAVDPRMNVLHSDPRFEKLLRRTNLPSKLPVRDLRGAEQSDS